MFWRVLKKAKMKLRTQSRSFYPFKCKISQKDLFWGKIKETQQAKVKSKSQKVIVQLKMTALLKIFRPLSMGRNGGLLSEIIREITNLSMLGKKGPLEKVLLWQG